VIEQALEVKAGEAEERAPATPLNPVDHQTLVQGWVPRPTDLGFSPDPPAASVPDPPGPGPDSPGTRPPRPGAPCRLRKCRPPLIVRVRLSKSARHATTKFLLRRTGD
jgi:hypothetical protein